MEFFCLFRIRWYWMFECLVLNMQRIYLKFVYQIKLNQIPLRQQSVCLHRRYSSKNNNLIHLHSFVRNGFSNGKMGSETKMQLFHFNIDCINELNRMQSKPKQKGQKGIWFRLKWNWNGIKFVVLFLPSAFCHQPHILACIRID